MAKESDGFFRRLLATFRVEAGEHLKLMAAGLLELEKEPLAEKRSAIVESVFREAHSLKGAARAVSMSEIESLCQSLESLFAAWKEGKIAPRPDLFDLLHQAVDGLHLLLASTEDQPAGAVKARTAKLNESLGKALAGAVSGVREADAGHEEAEAKPGARSGAGDRVTTEPRPPTGDTVRIATAKLDALLLKTEELLSAKLAAGQRAAELREMSGVVATWKRDWRKIQTETGVIRRELNKNAPDSAGPVMKVIEYLDEQEYAIARIGTRVTALQRSTEQDHRALGAMVDDLLADAKKALMLPFASILEGFPLLVRNLSRERAKEVLLAVHGSEIEIDKRILEEIKDALIHLVRNCVDHGIELPEERVRRNKVPRGTVTIAISQMDGGKVEILVADDGAGIDARKVGAAALEAGLVSPEKAGEWERDETLPLIFESGVSTSPVVTDISGRGLGLAIVREKAEQLGGAVAVETRPAAGTSFRLTLPLTLATFRGTLVRVQGRQFIIPTTDVQRAMRVPKEAIRTVENRETVQLNGTILSLVRLEDALELPPRASAGEPAEQAVVLGAAERRVAVLVDEVVDEREVLVKSLGKQLARVRNIAGATVLGAGQVVPILNVPDLLKSAMRLSGGAVQPAVVPVEGEKARKRILVAEDSITARTLLKNILEAAGYDVRTAVDGVDALTQLRAGEFDLVVSDVDMPRMSGFDLTVRIRGDKRTAELPVILVTALGSREDRERGIDAGANAYIVKSSFDQSNLLEVMRRLV